MNNLYGHICSLENLEVADAIARLGKKSQYGVIRHDRRRKENLLDLQSSLVTKSYKTSQYSVRTIFEKKERIIYKLPYYPDRIVHHAIMNVLERYFVAMFTADTYSCIKGRGIHAAVRNIKKALKDKEGTKYCLKLDIQKFYPSVNHSVLKDLLRRKFKDQNLLWLLDEIIDSAPGLPIGNYTSSYFANFYLAGLDHWVKESKGIKYYFRYLDDLVIFGSDKKDLHKLCADIRAYLSTYLQLNLKGNYQVFPTDSRGVDVLGYVFFSDHTRLRKSIKQQFARALARGSPLPTLAAYWGWVKHADAQNLMRKLIGKKNSKPPEKLI